MLRPDPSNRSGGDIGCQDRGAVGEQVPDEPSPDLADPADRHPPSTQRRFSPAVLGRGTHALEDAERGQYAAVAGATVLGRPTGDPAALPGDDVHVRDVGTDIARGHVPTAEG